MKDFVNVDLQEAKGIDKSFDFDRYPYPFRDNAFDYVIADNVFEHLENPVRTLDEFHRICKKEALIRIIVPYYNCKGAYNDITHKHFFNQTTFDNIINPDNHYAIKKQKKKFYIEKTKLIPTRFGMLFPGFLRDKASFVLGEIYKEIDVTLKVLK